MLDSQLEVREEALKEFAAKADPVLEVPPVAEHRLFNENDILGDLERDENGNVFIPPGLTDKQGRPVNQKGYLVDPNGNVIDNLNGKTMFPNDKIDPKTGEVPQPFAWERHNFNPHNLLGDFDRDSEDEDDMGFAPKLIPTNKGFHIDKKGRRVNKHGWLEEDPKTPLSPKAGGKP